MGTTITNASFPPCTTQVGNEESGTITGISCAGPCTATLYSATGVVLYSISTQLGQTGDNAAVSIAYSGGPPYVKQSTPSSITFTY